MTIVTEYSIGTTVHFKEYRTRHGEFAEGQIKWFGVYKDEEYNTNIRYHIEYLGEDGAWYETVMWEQDLLEQDAQYWDERCGTCFSNKYYQIKMKGENNEKNHN